MSKKMITFLGIGNYSRTLYSFEGEIIRETDFVQTALLQRFRPEEVLIFVTEDSKKKNWSGEKPKIVNENGIEIKYPEIPLSKILKDEFSDINFKPVTIKEGKDVDEIWENFSILQEQILSEDRIILDVTHSFRSIPIVALACIQYVRSLKQTVLEGIYYGAWEAGEQRQDQKYIAPIFDLTLFVELMDWSISVENFVNYGHISSLRNLVQTGSASMKQKKLRQNLQGLVSDMDWLNENIVTCRGQEIYDSGRINSIPNKLKKLKNNIEELPKPFAPMLEKIEDKLKLVADFEGEKIPTMVKRGMGSVKWCLDHDLIQQAYTILQENLISYFCFQGELDAMNKDLHRQLAAQAAATLEKPKEEWKAPACDHPEKIEMIQQEVGPHLLKLYERLSENRNDINHGGLPSNKKPEYLRNFVIDIFSEIQKEMGFEC